MFNVKRPQELPEQLKGKKYGHPEVVNEINKIFYRKCYLCEQLIASPEVEHFEPQAKNKNLIHTWTNLFLGCSHCNKIKSTKHTNLLDCSDTNTDVQQAIRLEPPNTLKGKVKVVDMLNCDKSNNTAKLLEDCYNLKDTGVRQIHNENMLDDIWDKFAIYMEHRNKAVSQRSTPNERKDALAAILEMADPNYEYSAFWYWQLQDDRKLLDLKKRLEDEVVG
ncbi:HNH endonuclease [Pseudovibrio sp. Alg231-02]|uniref:HNH endonuclease n=1 Tax=Pseudovibrio sp. Alg231-02 TaxID=1922223 RepID=UPI000D5601B2|nr:HNH endonuclease [Pseudovibrio sp. Alg231-02]